MATLKLKTSVFQNIATYELKKISHRLSLQIRKERKKEREGERKPPTNQ